MAEGIDSNLPLKEEQSPSSDIQVVMSLEAALIRLHSSLNLRREVAVPPVTVGNQPGVPGARSCGALRR